MENFVMEKCGKEKQKYITNGMKQNLKENKTDGMEKEQNVMKMVN